MLKSLLVLSAAAVFSSCLVTANSVGTLVNLGSLEYNIHAYNLGHQCASFSLGANSWQTWNTPGTGNCLVNVDTLVIALSGNANLNCSVIIAGGYQFDSVSGYDVNMGTNILVGTDGIDLCVTANAVSVPPTGGYQVRTRTTCGACPPASSHLSSLGSEANVVGMANQKADKPNQNAGGAAPIQAGAFEVATSSALSFSMYDSQQSSCNTVNLPSNNPYAISTWSAGMPAQGDTCPTPIAGIAFWGSNLRSCGLNFTSTSWSSSFAGVLGVSGSDVCLTGRVASPNEVMLTTDCPVCQP